MLALAALSVVLRLAALPFDPRPLPRIEDEFSYLLAGDTFASGRLTVPTHPLWRSFETVHVLSHPTRASKYQPGQGAILAAGKLLFGAPFYGVVLSVAALCASLFWMLEAWAPRRWALLVSLFAVLVFGPGDFWVDTYFGGAHIAIASALMLGAYPRILKRRSGAGWAFAAGAAIGFLTRPYEAGLLAAALLLALFVSAVRRPNLRKASVSGRLGNAVWGCRCGGDCFPGILRLPRHR